MSFWGPPIFKGCLYPVLNAVVAGALGYGLGYVIGKVAMVERPDMTGWSVALVAGILIWTVDHFWWMAIQERAWMRALEAIKPREEVGAADPATTRVVVTSEDRRRGEYVNLPAREGQLYQFAAGVLEGIPASYRIWAKGGGPFTETEFSALLAEMVSRGLAERRGNGRVDVTPAGKNMLAGILRGELSPTERETLLDDGWKPFDKTRHDGENAVGEWAPRGAESKQ